MSRRLLLPLAISLLAVTPVLAADPSTTTETTDPVVKEAEARTAQANALKAQYEAQKAAADARLAPLQQFAGDGTSHIENGGGQMEAAYLAAVSMRDAANVIDREVARYIAHHPPRIEETEAGRTQADLARAIEILRRIESGERRPPEPEANGAGNTAAAAPGLILLLTEKEDAALGSYAAFHTETQGVIHASVGVLGLSGDTCPAPATDRTELSIQNFSSGNKLGFSGGIAAVGAIIGLLQSETHVYGFDQLGDDALLVSALTASGRNRYFRQSELLSAPRYEQDPVHLLLQQVANCETALRAKISSMPRTNDEQKAAVAVVQAVLTRLTGFIERLTTPAADGSVRLAAVLRASQTQRTTSPYVLRVHVNRAGGTMITVKNLWTAVGAASIRLSGGVIASYSLSNRSTGEVLLGGTVICRTALTGLRSAIDLQSDDLVCAGDSPRASTAGANERRSRRNRRLSYDRSVFRVAE